MNRFASAGWPLNAAYVSLLLATGFMVLGSVSLIVALAGLHRLTGHVDPLRVPAWFWYYRADPAVRRWLAIGALVSAVLLALPISAVLAKLRRPLYGAARWASEGELRRGGLRAKTGLLLGRKDGTFLSFGGSEHVLVYAPTRSGKGVGIVIPNLLSWPDSVVVLDIKRENWAATAGFRAAHGQTVLLFDPLDPEGRTVRYNPLGHIDRHDPVQVLDELQKLAVMLFPAPEHADPFWSEAARTGFVGVGALVAATPDASFCFAEIYRTLVEPGARERLPERLCALPADATAPGAIAALNDFCSASDNTFASIRQTITARMNLWLNPHVAAATVVSDVDLAAFRRNRISLYLAVSPDNLLRVAPLYNLLFQQLLDLNTRVLPGPGNPVQVLVLLDEFARLGPAPMLAQAFAYVAGYGLRLMPVIQSPAQLRALYGPDVAEEIASNCGVEVAFAPKELKVAQDLSDRLGAYTYEGRSLSRPAGLSSGRRTHTATDQRRPLMLPQELIQLPADALIVLRAGQPPVRGRKITYYRERGFRQRVSPPPSIAARPALAAAPAVSAGPIAATASPEPGARRPARFAPADPVADALREAPLPPDADDDAVEAWITRYLDQSLAADAQEVEHAR